MRFDDDELEQTDLEENKELENATKNTMDFRVEMAHVGTSQDVPDYPQNPYANHRTKNESLFFADGERSVDFVLVWKRLVPSCDEERSDALKARELNDIHQKETERSERREVFEENLIHEGLELEREIVDEEINFVKVHAPLEVLRRYAEILKLRLPMKEVSNDHAISISTLIQ